MSDHIVLGLAEVSLELSSSGREDMAATVEAACVEIDRLEARITKLESDLLWYRRSYYGEHP